jgi:hypothetical protein
MNNEHQIKISTKRLNSWVIPAYARCNKLGLYFLLPLLERVPILKVTAGEGPKKIVSVSRLGEVVKYQR